MLPVVKGEDATRSRIVAYTLVLVAFTLAPVATSFLGAIYARLGRDPGRCVHRARRAPPAPSGAFCGAPPLPLLYCLPRAALLRDGRRRRALIRNAASGSRSRPIKPRSRPAVRPESRSRCSRSRSSSRSSTSASEMADDRRNGGPLELVYVPAPSWQPAPIGVGAGRRLPASLFTWWPYGVAGDRRPVRAAFWIRDARADYTRMPRHQRVAMVVLAAPADAAHRQGMRPAAKRPARPRARSW